MIPSSRGGRLLAGLAITVGAVLVHGFATGQRKGPGSGESPVVEPSPVAPALRPDLEKTPLSYHSDYWRQVGERVKPKFLLVGSRSTPALVIAPGLAVSAPRVVEEQREAGFELLGGGPDSDLALLKIEPSSAAGVFVPSDPASLHPGLLVAAVSLTPEGALLVAPGYLASTPNPPEEDGELSDEDSLEVSIALPRSLTAAAIVDLDGNLVGAAFDVGESVRLVSSETLARVVERLRRQPFCNAIEVAAMDDRVKQLLGVTGGVVVERVRETSFVPGPSIREGDVLLEWAGRGIASDEEFRRTYEAQSPGARVAFAARRGRRQIRGQVVVPRPDCRPAGDLPVALPKIGMTLGGTHESEPGWEVLALHPGGPAARGRACGRGSHLDRRRTRAWRRRSRGAPGFRASSASRPGPRPPRSSRPPAGGVAG